MNRPFSPLRVMAFRHDAAPPHFPRPLRIPVCALCLLLCLFGSDPALAGDLLWFTGERPSARAFEAIGILERAAEEGLRPSRYAPLDLRHAVATAEQGPALSQESRTELDQRLTSVMIAYLRDLHFGQIDPRLIRENFSLAVSDGFDPDSHLRQALREDRLTEAVTDAAPALPLYSNLRLALAHYRKIAVDPVTEALWSTPLPPGPHQKLEPGQTYAGLAILTLRLVTLGDLSCDTLPPKTYAGTVVEGVKTFQARHGLNPDGVIGRLTLDSLNVSPAARVRQIELAMERLRWTPFLQAPRMVAVNVPEHVLEAYEVRDGVKEEGISMRVIIGKALDTRTPLFDEQMRFIEFSPYWNVPPSIARSEVIPAIRRDPAYFGRQGFEFVGNGQVITTLAPEHLDAVLRGGMRIRQRPGPRNALGDIKFVFPNKDNIFLHHTPSPGLFERDRRDLSHGCIRVQDPVGLANFVLKNEPEWTEERIRAAMGAGVSRTIRLREPVRVLIAYSTVRVRDGRVHFFADIYGQDRALDQALTRSGQIVQ